MPSTVEIFGRKVISMIFHRLAQVLMHSACVITANDVRYTRMKALEKMSGNHYKQDYISGNLGDYILTGAGSLMYLSDLCRFISSNSHRI